MKIISKCLAIWLIKKEVISQEEKELYEYAIYSFILTILPVIMVMIIGTFMNRLIESIFIIIPFMFIRKYSGGYHAKHSWVCMISSCGILFICVYVVAHIQYYIWINFILVAAVMGLITFSPIDSENRRLDMLEKRIYKTRTVYTVLAFTMLYGIFLLLNKTYAICIMEGLVLTACLQIPCVIIRLYGSLLGSDQK